MVKEYWMVCDGYEPINENKYTSYFDAAEALTLYQSKGYCIQCFKEQCTSDTVSHPLHYTSGSIECIDAIRAALTPEEFRGFCKGNVIKYTWRERIKGGDESLKKAEWYLKRLTE
jgi:Protein of unknwon function (DUF3310).